MCKKKNIWITFSNISHESHESCIAIRCIMFSWFFQITKNHKTLENVETNIWFELFIIHRDLILFVRISFDFAHHFDAMSYRFFVAMELTDLSSLSNALMCRKKWNSFAVIANRDVYLNSKKNAHRIIAKWRTTAVEQIITAFQLIKKTEMQTFDEKFYFYFRFQHSTKQIFISFFDVDSAFSFIN